MLAHNPSGIFNASLLAKSLEVSSMTVSRYLDLMVDLLLVRRLQPWTANVARPYYYRTATGQEIDLILEFSGQEKWAIEIKRSTAPVLSKGFYQACEDIRPDRRFVVYTGQDRFSMQEGIIAIPLAELMEELLKL